MRAKLKLVATKSILALLVVTGIFGILSFIIGEFDEWQWRTLATLFLLVSLCIGVLCNSLLFETRYKVAGAIGSTLSVLSSFTFIALLWWNYEVYDSSTDFLVPFAGVTASFAFASVVVSLLLNLARNSADAVRRIMWITIGSVLACASIVSLFVIDEDIANDDLLIRFFGVMSILATVGSIATPIIGKITKGKTDEPSNEGPPTELPSDDSYPLSN